MLLCGVCNVCYFVMCARFLLAFEIFFLTLTVNLGLLEKVVELCDVFKQDGCHRNCCFGKVAFNEEARCATQCFIEGKKLVGKIDEEQSGGKGNIIHCNCQNI